LATALTLEPIDSFAIEYTNYDSCDCDFPVAPRRNCGPVTPIET
jgi:hypothetical protein